MRVISDVAASRDGKPLCSGRTRVTLERIARPCTKKNNPIRLNASPGLAWQGQQRAIRRDFPAWRFFNAFC
jgi:hypothetical protein